MLFKKRTFKIHPIYDDTAVVEAYKSGDDSKLTDDKDKYILKELKIRRF